MPVIIKATFEDESTEEFRLPAQIWRRNPEAVSKMLVTEKKIEKIEIDPHRETADVDIENNFYPRRIREYQFRLSKSTRPGNPLRDKKKEEEKKQKIAHRGSRINGKERTACVPLSFRLSTNMCTCLSYRLSTYLCVCFFYCLCVSPRSSLEISLTFSWILYVYTS